MSEYEYIVIILLVLIYAKDNRANKNALKFLRRLWRKLRRK